MNVNIPTPQPGDVTSDVHVPDKKMCAFKNGQNAGAVFPPLALTRTYDGMVIQTCFE